PQRNRVLVMLHRGDRRPRRDAAQQRDAGRLGPPRTLLARAHQGGRGPLAGHPPLEHSLALQRLQVVERRAGGELELLADLADGGRHPVPLPECPDELEHLALPGRHLSHLVSFTVVSLTVFPVTVAFSCARTSTG